MTVSVGVWIDHREAILVKFEDGKSETIRIESESESQLRRASDRTSGPFEALQVPSDDTRERKRDAELGQFYDAVISHFAQAASLLVFGPGEAKHELKKRLAKHHISANCVIETSDKMTEPQIVEKVTEFFHAKS